VNAGLPSHHFTAPAVSGPRFRAAGDLTLDQLHHDGRVADEWLGLHPRDFAILWRLAECPGVAVSSAILAADLPLSRFGTEPGSIAAQVDYLRSRLEAAGLTRLIAGDAAGGYVLDVPPA